MAAFQHTPRLMSEVDVDDVLQYLCGSNGQEHAALAAIRDNDEQKVRETSLDISATTSLQAKLEAVKLDKPECLRLLLERDENISEELVVEAFRLKGRRCIRILLDFGWDINRPLCSASPLW